MIRYCLVNLELLRWLKNSMTSLNVYMQQKPPMLGIRKHEVAHSLLIVFPFLLNYFALLDTKNVRVSPKGS